MKVRLKILHGTLQDTHGHRAGLEVKVRGPRFVIGNAADCSMCCRSDSVFPHHCEVVLEPGRTVLRTLNEAATFVNGQRVEHEQDLRPGDILRIGRLDFEVLIDDAIPATARPSQSEPTEPIPPAAQQRQPEPGEPLPAAAPLTEPEPPSDAAAEEISNLLVQADERDRAIRQEHPELRVLHLETPPAKPTEPEPASQAEADEADKPRKRGKKKPGKLPVRPPKNEISGDDSTEAAQEALRKLFSR